MKFTPQQRAELLRHKIAAYEVFNAMGKTLVEAKLAMTTNKEAVMVNGPRCPNDPNHTLRSRYGKCVGCNPATIEMQKRKKRAAAVYLTESPSTGLIKVGHSVDHKVRLERLNFHRYGGAQDWRFVAVARASHAGKLEHAIHVELADFKEPVVYDPDGTQPAFYELFRCSPVIAFRVFKSEAIEADAEFVLQPGKL